MESMRPILKIFVPFLIGLITFFVGIEYFKKINYTNLTLFLFWITLSLMGIYLLSRLAKKSWTIFHYMLWFSVAGLVVLINQPRNDPKHFSYSEAEIFEVVVDQVNQTSNANAKFIRSELSVKFTLKEQQKKPATGQILAYIDTATIKKIKPSDLILIQATPEEICNQGNPGEFDLKLFWKTKGFEHQWFLDSNDVVLLEKGNYRQGFFDRTRETVIAALSDKLNGDVFAVAIAILLGDKSYLHLELKDAFSGAGAMHLLAVSGLHVGMFMVILQWIFKVFGRRLPRWSRFAMILIILWIYAGITGFSPSVNRAVTMFSFVALGSILGRRYNSLDGLLASAMILLVINPNNLFDIGFQLSYLAMFGILLFSPLLEKSINLKNKGLKFVWSGTAVALAAQFTTFPLTLYYFHQFPNYFLLTNLGLMLISWFIMAIGLGLISLGSIPFLGSLISMAFVVIVSALIAFIQWISELPLAITQGFRVAFWELCLLYIAMALLLSSLYQRSKIWLYSSLIIFVFFLLHQSYQSVKDAQSEEFLILNSNDPTFFYRRGKNADLIVISNKKDIESKIQFAKRSLDVYYGVNTRIHCLARKNGSYQTEGIPISFVVKSALVHFQVNKNWFTYVFGDYFRETDLKQVRQVVTGPWIGAAAVQNYYENTPIWELKNRGAYSIDLRK
jgi:competence protein ComEC